MSESTKNKSDKPDDEIVPAEDRTPVVDDSPELDETDIFNRKGRFFDRIDWASFWISAILAFVVYFYSLPPSVTLEDSGELAVAAEHLGVPHPPGYPSWTMLNWVFVKAFSWVKYRGWDNPAWAIALCSAVCGAFAAACASMLLCKSGRHMLRYYDRSGVIPIPRQNIVALIGGVVSSLLFAYSPIMWSQSVIVEVYALNALFLTAICLFLYTWMCRQEARYLYIIGFLFGLGQTNYQVLLLFAAALAVAVFLQNPRQAMVFAGVSIIFLASYLRIKEGPFNAIEDDSTRAIAWLLTTVLLGYLVASIGGIFQSIGQQKTQRTVAYCVCSLVYMIALSLVMKAAPETAAAAQGGALQHLTMLKIGHPTGNELWIYLGLNLALLLLVYHFFPHGRAVAITLLLAEIGVGFYLYMPVSSETNPPMNWGYPRTFEGFQHAIFRKQYEAIRPAAIFTESAIGIPVVTEEFKLKMGVYLTDLRETFKLPYVILGLLPFTAWSVRVEGRRYSALWISLLFAAGAIFFSTIQMAFIPATDNIHFMERIWRAFVTVIVWLLFAGGLIIGVMSALRLFRGLFAPESRDLTKVSPVQPVLGSITQNWLLTLTVGFIVMSVLLVSLANLKLDIQDYFIQRVKFISSHGLFVLFIGYGLILTLGAICKLTARFGKKYRFLNAMPAAALGVVMASPIIPVHQNWHNDFLITRAGGSDQRGHDYGWQFGYYQLRGRNGIMEEVEPHEEPLPNPEFPPPMTQDAVFFGGTDPGRFVPTYMIYSAKVRSDVFLITQNALADGTYMNVMRDLYGNDIWIPSVADNNQAFQSYLNDVRMGRRPASAEIKIENGRVQVMGVGGVMIINGYLAKAIYDNNIPRHDFYVEESYVLDWMYPYLAPHGLIMKIRDNKGDGKLSRQVVRDDIDFWDWYTQRLVDDPEFRRDVVAQKSFSKLRSAIAGLYAWHARKHGFRRFTHEAEFAFQQSVSLYPLSPEANFRYAELLVYQERHAEARQVMQSFHEKDPGNTRVEVFLKRLDVVESLGARKKELEKHVLSAQGGKQVDINKALELAQIYLKGQEIPKFVNLTRQMINTPKLPAQVYLRLYHLCVQAKRVDEMNMALTKFLELNPNDIQAIVNMAAVKVIKRQYDQAFPLLEKAVKLGGPQIASAINQDQRFAEIRNHPQYRQAVGSSTQAVLPLNGTRPGAPNLNGPVGIPGLTPQRAPAPGPLGPRNPAAPGRPQPGNR